jgi:hypothetical protein
MSKDWKAREVIYEFDITSFLRKRCLCGQKCIFSGYSRLLAQVHSSWADAKKFITLIPFIISRSVSNRWKTEKLFYVSHV